MVGTLRKELVIAVGISGSLFSQEMALDPGTGRGVDFLHRRFEMLC